MQSPIMSGFLTLLGICLGSSPTYFLTQKSQREQWLRDNRKQESKELLIALADCFANALKLYLPDQGRSGRDELLFDAATSKALINMRSCIYISDVVIRTSMETRWVQAVYAHERDFNVRALSEIYGELRAEIVQAQLKR